MEEKQNPLAEKILSLLVFEEKYDSILNELPEERPYAIADELKFLIVKDFVKPCRDLDNDTGSGMVYDSDSMRSFSFILTAKGISYLEEFAK